MNLSASAMRALVTLTCLYLSGCSSIGPSPAAPQAGPIEHQLMAEIALQRAQYAVAVEEYLSLAQQSANPEYAQRATELAYDFGFDAVALQAARRWTALSPEEPVAHAYLGRLCVISNDPECAWNSLNISLGPADQRTDTDYLALAGEFSDPTESGRALAVFDRFAELYPDDAGIAMAVASLAAQQGNYDLAIEAARHAVLLRPDWMYARIRLARFLLADGDQDSAFEQLAFGLEMNPGLEMELEFINLLVIAGAVPEAEARLTRLSERYPQDPDLVRARAGLAMERGDYDAAIADYGFLLSQAYYVNEAFWRLGQMSFEQQNYPQAIRYFQRVGTGPWLFPARNAVSQCYLALGEFDLALNALRGLAQEYPKFALDTLVPQAEIIAAAGNSAEALQLVNAVVIYRPWDMPAWLYRGGLLEQQGRVDDAIDSFRQAYELSPDNATALNALGYTMTVAGKDYAAAQAYIERALQTEPDNPAILDSMGWVLYRQGRAAEALDWLSRAYAILPDPEIAAHLGEALWSSGSQDEAIDIWTAALLAHPDNPVLNETTRRYMQ